MSSVAKTKKEEKTVNMIDISFTDSEESDDDDKARKAIGVRVRQSRELRFGANGLQILMSADSQA